MDPYIEHKYFLCKNRIIFSYFILNQIIVNCYSILPKELINIICLNYLSLHNDKLIDSGGHFFVINTKKGLFGMGDDHNGFFRMCDNNNGELGIGEYNDKTKLRFICNNVKTFSCGDNHMLILRNDILYGCGSNGFGQLGLGDQIYFNQLTKINIKNVLLIECGYVFSYVLTRDGLFSCGDNQCGQLGITSLDTDSDDFTKVDDGKIPIFTKININNVITLSCGGTHVLIINDDGLYGCGSNTLGQLGLDENTYWVFTKINILNVFAISCGGHHSMVLTSEGLYSSGSNYFGELGDSFSRIRDRKTFQKIKLDNIISFSCKYSNSIVLTKKGLYVCDKKITFREITEMGLPKDIFYFYHGTNIVSIINKNGLFIKSTKKSYYQKYYDYHSTFHKIDIDI